MSLTVREPGRVTVFLYKNTARSSDNWIVVRSREGKKREKLVQIQSAAGAFGSVVFT
jgi:hypothetical protein